LWSTWTSRRPRASHLAWAVRPDRDIGRLPGQGAVPTRDHDGGDRERKRCVGATAGPECRVSLRAAADRRDRAAGHTRYGPALSECRAMSRTSAAIATLALAVLTSAACESPAPPEARPQRAGDTPAVSDVTPAVESPEYQTRQRTIDTTGKVQFNEESLVRVH